jgi:uncharacterized protein (TIGR00251 family)
VIKFNEPFEIKVQTRARKNEIKVTDDVVQVKITEIPENGKANTAIIELFSEECKVTKSNIIIIRGETSSKKVIFIKKP